MARYRMRRTNRNGSRRKLVWARTENAVLPSASPGQDNHIDLMAAWRQAMGWESTPGITVRRMRVCILAMSPAPLDEWITAPAAPVVGAIRWNMDGETGLPNPTNPDGRAADWMMWQMVSPHAQGGRFAQFEIDVKSQRKLEEMRQTIFMVRSGGEGGVNLTPSLRVSASLLLALP